MLKTRHYYCYQMSNVFGDIGKKIGNTLENVQKDLSKTSLAKSITAMAQSLSEENPSTNLSGPPAGTKSRLFSDIFRRSMCMRTKIANKFDKVPGDQVNDSQDDLQLKLPLFRKLEKEFCDLLEAYEIMLVERIRLEELLTRNDQIDSLDDFELVGQYYRSLQDSTKVISFYNDKVFVDFVACKGRDCEINKGIRTL